MPLYAHQPKLVNESPTIDNPSGEKVQSLFERIPEMTLGLEEGKRILNRSDCPVGIP